MPVCKFKNMASYLKEKRLNAQYSQEQLADHIGFKNGQFVSNIERGLCTIPPKHFTKTAQILKIERQELVEAYLLDVRQLVEHA